MAEFEVSMPTKRRRISHSGNGRASLQASLLAGLSPTNGEGSQKPGAVIEHFDDEDEKKDISISATSKQAGQTVAPFLAKHIPDQYAPAGGSDVSTRGRENPNTKYCYRHRPDLKCRRQANEPSMDELQRV